LYNGDESQGINVNDFLFNPDFLIRDIEPFQGFVYVLFFVNPALHAGPHIKPPRGFARLQRSQGKGNPDRNPGRDSM